MKLSVKERLVVGSLLPKEGNIMVQTLARDIREKTKLLQKEFKDVGFKVTPQGGYQWDKKKAKSKKVDFTSAELGLLKKQVDILDKQNKITQELLDICLKIKEAK